MEIDPGIQSLLDMQEYFHKFNNDPEPWDGDISIIDGDLHMYGDGEWTNLERKGEKADMGKLMETKPSWNERFGTPPPTKKGYISRKTCGSFWSWLFYTWNFINNQGYREVGRRFLGQETIHYYVVPRGELRF